jgi:hypothetical protein
MSTFDQTQRPLPQMSLRMRLALSAFLGFIMVTAAIGIVATGMDALASFGLRSELSAPAGAYAIGFSVLWVIAVGALMVLLRRFRGVTTATKGGVELDLQS